jgi:hypothetical protein
MAQDLIGQYDNALIMSDDGFYLVDYAKLGLKMTTLDQWQQHGVDAVLLH